MVCFFEEIFSLFYRQWAHVDGIDMTQQTLEATLIFLRLLNIDGFLNLVENVDIICYKYKRNWKEIREFEWSTEKTAFLWLFCLYRRHICHENRSCIDVLYLLCYNNNK